MSRADLLLLNSIDYLLKRDRFSVREGCRLLPRLRTALVEVARRNWKCRLMLLYVLLVLSCARLLIDRGPQHLVVEAAGAISVPVEESLVRRLLLA